MSETQQSITEWANATFGEPIHNESIATRALDEMHELLDALYDDDKHPKAADEAADVLIVLMRLFDRLGTTWQAEVDRKMAINRARKWNLHGNGHGSHIKDAQ